MDGDELLTVAEIARGLKLSEQTIRNWLDDGRIPHVRVGERRVRVWRSDFEAFVESSSNDGTRNGRPASDGIWDGFVADPVDR